MLASVDAHPASLHLTAKNEKLKQRDFFFNYATAAEAATISLYSLEIFQRRSSHNI